MPESVSPFATMPFVKRQLEKLANLTFVPLSRLINTTAPLTGGGPLSADLTLAISPATTLAPGSMSAVDKTKLDAISGTNTGDQVNITGNAATATALQNSRNINGVAFNGTADIVINAVDATARIASTEKAAANGVATLDAGSKIPSVQLPLIAISSTFVVNSQAAQLALTTEEGDVAVRTDLNKSFIRLSTTLGTMSDWQELLTPTDSVLSVNGLTGAVSLGAAVTKTDDTNITLTLGGAPTTAALTAISFTLGWTGILSSARGGTANGFTKFSGPAASEKTFTLPNASDTIACLSQTQIFTFPQTITAVTRIGAVTSTTAPSSADGTGLVVQTNLSNGLSEVSLISLGESANTAFIFYKKTGSSTVDKLMRIAPGFIAPGEYNTQSCAEAGRDWTTGYFVTSINITSDERRKQDIQPFNDKELDAWAKVEWCKWRNKDAVELKNSNARWHFGLIAQQVYEIFKFAGLDAFTLGLCCYDKWQEEVGFDEDTEEEYVIRPAGDRWALRYDECFAIEAAYQRRRLDRIEAKL